MWIICGEVALMESTINSSLNMNIFLFVYYVFFFFLLRMNKKSTYNNETPYFVSYRDWIVVDFF